MKALWWTTLFLALGVAIALFATRTRPALVTVAPARSTGSEVVPARAVCPPRSLLDDGACIPVPEPKTPEEEFIPRLPSQPASFEEYLLPAEAAARLGKWSDFSLPEDLGVAADDPAALIAARPNELVRVVGLLDKSPRLLAKGKRWVLCGHEADNDDTRLAVLYAPLLVETDAAIGDEVDIGAPLGKALPGGVGLGVYKLRPGKELKPVADVMRPSESIPTDPRNYLMRKNPKPGE